MCDNLRIQSLIYLQKNIIVTLNLIECLSFSFMIMIVVVRHVQSHLLLSYQIIQFVYLQKLYGFSLTYLSKHFTCPKI